MKDLKVFLFCAAALALSAAVVPSGVKENSGCANAEPDGVQPEYSAEAPAAEEVVTDEIPTDEVPTAPEVWDDPQKMVWHKMLNTIDYYDSISGTTVYNTGSDVNDCTVVSFESDVVTGKAFTTSFRVNSDSPRELLDKEKLSGYDIIDSSTSVSDGETVREYDENGKEISRGCVVFSRKRENVDPVPDEERYWINEDGEQCTFLRGDATNSGYARRCIFPQELTVGYLHDFDLWSVDGIEEYNGRKCCVISGRAEEEYGQKLKVDSFEMHVDYETGVLLEYEGYSPEGEVTRFLYTDNIVIQ